VGKPYGETRYTWGTTPTDRRFTGQRSEEASLGSLYDYGARFYSPYLGRFLSADTMVPQAGNPQTLNRYSYVNNSPLKYVDPTGHAFRPPPNFFVSMFQGQNVHVNSAQLLAATGNVQLAANYEVGMSLVVGFFGCQVAEDGTIVDDPVGRMSAGIPGPAIISAETGPFINAGVEAAESVVENLGDDVIKAAGAGSRASVIADLANGTTQSRLIAQAMENGDIGLNILDDAAFKAARQEYGVPWRAGAFQVRNQAYLRASSSDISRDAVHEGTHALQFLADFKGTNQQWEKPAYFYARQFQLQKGRPSTYGNLADILKFIRKNY
jgi:RHS repeat-associated protein